MRVGAADNAGRVFSGFRLRFWFHERSTALHHREVEETGGGVGVGEQRRDFAAKILVAACPFEKGEAFASRPLERRLEETLDLAPAFRLHAGGLPRSNALAFALLFRVGLRLSQPS